MRPLTRREKGLLVLLGVGVPLAALSLRGGGLGFGGESVPPPSGAPLGEPPVVRMDLLATRAAEFDPDGRDLFKYYVPPPPRPVEVPRPATPIPPPPPPVQAPIAPPRPRIQPQPQAPQPPFSLIGVMGPKNDRIAAFEGTDKEVFLARVGDVVHDKFQLLEFKYDSVVFGYVEPQFKGKTTELKKAGT